MLLTIAWGLRGDDLGIIHDEISFLIEVERGSYGSPYELVGRSLIVLFSYRLVKRCLQFLPTKTRGIGLVDVEEHRGEWSEVREGESECSGLAISRPRSRTPLLSSPSNVQGKQALFSVTPSSSFPSHPPPLFTAPCCWWERLANYSCSTSIGRDLVSIVGPFGKLLPSSFWKSNSPSFIFSPTLIISVTFRWRRKRFQKGGSERRRHHHLLYLPCLSKTLKGQCCRLLSNCHL